MIKFSEWVATLGGLNLGKEKASHILNKPVSTIYRWCENENMFYDESTDSVYELKVVREF